MSLRLSAALGTSPEFWLRMQIQHDLWRAQRAKQPKVRPFPHTTKSKELALA
jgi:plasmid maintenance system antidote protein VapI